MHVREDLDELTSEGHLDKNISFTFAGKERVRYRLVSESGIPSQSKGVTAAENAFEKWGDLPLSNLIDEVCSEYSITLSSKS
jgi:hypothetical protein